MFLFTRWRIRRGLKCFHAVDMMNWRWCRRDGYKSVSAAVGADIKWEDSLRWRDIICEMSRSLLKLTWVQCVDVLMRQCEMTWRHLSLLKQTGAHCVDDADMHITQPFTSSNECDRLVVHQQLPSLHRIRNGSLRWRFPFIASTLLVGWQERLLLCRYLPRIIVIGSFPWDTTDSSCSSCGKLAQLHKSWKYGSISSGQCEAGTLV